MGHFAMHNLKREPQNLPSVLLPSSIPKPEETNVVNTASIAFDTRLSVLTTLLKTVAIPTTDGSRTFTSTRVDTVIVTDPSSLAAIQASQSSSNARQTESASRTTATASETSKAASSSSSGSSSNLSTLIPAIVVPVAFILIASFVAFWWMMRRRHKKQQKKEPQFVMANKSEKSAIRRGDSHSSGHSSTRELVPMSKLEKESVFTTTEVRRSLDLFPPKYASSEIGVARPMTPPDKSGGPEANQDKSYRNFSSIRPGTRSRSGTGSGNHKTLANQNGSIASSPGRNSPKSFNRGPPRVQGPSIPPQRPYRPEDSSSDTASRGSIPPQIVTKMDRGRRAPPPQSLNPPTPTGAFNGASPISQYSPIVKDQPNLGAAGAVETTEDHSPLTAPVSRSLPLPTRATDSPINDNVLSHENMRIARLANSSRLGFSHSPVEANFPSSNPRSLPPPSQRSRQGELTVISPQLPLHSTADDVPARSFAHGPGSPAGGSSIYPSPSIGAAATPRIGGGYSSLSLPQNDNAIGIASSTAHQRHISAISRLSSDDGYVDMEYDAKSEVSSLDDREKWEMDMDKHDAVSQRGAHYDGFESVGPSVADRSVSPPGKSSSAVNKPNLRDRDSEGPFVLSRY